MFEPFRPPLLLRSPHAQTLLASVGRKPAVAAGADPLRRGAHEQLLTTSEGVILQAWVTPASEHAGDAAPLVVLIHGWLGSADSSYALSAAWALNQAGYQVARLNLRDHGDTAHLNEGLFHSARTREVVEAVSRLAEGHGGRTGVLGFSLGGNFALRVARALGLPTLAVCPAVDPPATMRAIDGGWSAYRYYFLRKWRRSLLAKQSAFPDLYDFSAALPLRSVAALTDLFVRYHTDFPDTGSYLAAYTLTGKALAGTDATVVIARDDPIIPQDAFHRLPRSIEVVAMPRGGHCGFVEGHRGPSWLDREAVRYFDRALR
ncbi:MAG: alpha/beta fold hydrolase [Pseudomonadales bacterium]